MGCCASIAVVPPKHSAADVLDENPSTCNISTQDPQSGESETIQEDTTSDDPKIMGGVLVAVPACLSTQEKVTVEWAIIGQTTSTGDWIGVYEGTEEDTGACASSLLVMGTATGSVVLTAPENPGKYHFRYFFATGLAAAISETITVHEPEPQGETTNDLTDPPMPADACEEDVLGSPMGPLSPLPPPVSPPPLQPALERQRQRRSSAAQLCVDTSTNEATQRFSKIGVKLVQEASLAPTASLQLDAAYDAALKRCLSDNQRHSLNRTMSLCLDKPMAQATLPQAYQSAKVPVKGRNAKAMVTSKPSPLEISPSPQVQVAVSSTPMFLQLSHGTAKSPYASFGKSPYSSMAKSPYGSPYAGSSPVKNTHGKAWLQGHPEAGPEARPGTANEQWDNVNDDMQGPRSMDSMQAVEEELDKMLYGSAKGYAGSPQQEPPSTHTAVVVTVPEDANVDQQNEAQVNTMADDSVHPYLSCVTDDIPVSPHLSLNEVADTSAVPVHQPEAPRDSHLVDNEFMASTPTRLDTETCGSGDEGLGAAPGASTQSNAEDIDQQLIVRTGSGLCDSDLMMGMTNSPVGGAWGCQRRVVAGTASMKISSIPWQGSNDVSNNRDGCLLDNELGTPTLQSPVETSKAVQSSSFIEHGHEHGNGQVASHLDQSPQDLFDKSPQDLSKEASPELDRMFLDQMVANANMEGGSNMDASSSGPLPGGANTNEGLDQILKSISSEEMDAVKSAEEQQVVLSPGSASELPAWALRSDPISCKAEQAPKPPHQIAPSAPSQSALHALSMEFLSVDLPVWSMRSSAVHLSQQALSVQKEAAQAPYTELVTSSGLRLRIGHVSQRNVTPEEPLSKPNQDAFCIETGLGDPDTHLLAVFDGHGKDGHLCAQYARAELPVALRKSAHFNDELGKAFSAACKQVNLEMHREPSVPDVRSGTTSIAMCLRDGHMTIANVGDSRAILGTIAEDGSLRAVDLSQDQTPFREDERERAMACGAEVLTLDELEGNVELMEPEEWDPSDPPRLWVPCTGYPGTAFTRSMGDSLAESIGVFAEPELCEQEVTTMDRFVVICSDGVTEFLSSQQVVDMVEKHAGPQRDPVKACRAIADESVRLWLEMDDHTDDITIIIAFLEAPEPKGGTPSPSPSPSYGSMSLQNGLGYTSITGDWFSAELMKHALGLGAPLRPQRAPRTKRQKKSVASLSLSISCGLDSNGPATHFKDRDGTGVPAKDVQRVLEAVKANILCEELEETVVKDMLSRMSHRVYEKGEVVFAAGEPGEHFYALDKGAFGMYVPQAAEPASPFKGLPKAQEGAHMELVHTYCCTAWGTYPSFGEMAILGGPRVGRPATVTALSKGALWCLHRDTFHRCKAQAPKSVSKLSTEEENFVVPTFGELPVKDVELIACLDKATSRSALFSQFRRDQRRRLFDLMDKQVVHAGDIVYRQGEPGHRFYVVATGHFEVLVTSGKEKPKVVHQYSSGGDEETWSIFGEQALLYPKARGSTVRARTDGVLWVLHSKTFQSVVKKMYTGT